MCSLFACNALKKLGQFYIDYNEPVTYAANLPINIPLTISSPDITTNSEQVFSNNDTRKDLITSIKLNQLTISVTSPAGQSLSFLKNVSIFLSTDSLAEVEIAHKDNVPGDVGTSMNLDINDVELRDYIKADKIKLRIAGTADQLVTKDINLNVYSKFFVQANLLKAL